MTERTNTNTELSERLLSAVDAIGDGVWEWDIASGKVFCSRGLLELVGQPASDSMLTITEFMAMIEPVDLAVALRAMGGRVPQSPVFRFKCRLSDPTFVDRWFEIKGATEFDGNDAPRRSTGIIQDISARERMFRALSAQQNQFENLAENVPGALNRYIILPDGTQTMDYVSPAFFEITELTPEDIAHDSTKLWQIIHEDDVAATAASVEAAAVGLETWDQSFRLRTKSGAIKWLHGRGRPWRRPDGVTVFDSVIIDITQLKETENELRTSREQLMQAQKFEAIGKLTGGIAHDFNNLLAIIMGNLELLQDTEQATISPLVGPALDASQRGADLVRKMLSFARQADLEYVSTDLNQVVADSESWISRAIPAHIRLNKRLNPGLPPILADQSFLENAFLNLVMNACDAMPKGGEIAVTTRPFKADADELARYGLTPGDYIALDISDTGQGIAPDHLNKVFDPFFSTKGKSSHKGRGMGLAVVDGFMRQSHGAVFVHSELGVKTTFTLVFPVNDAAQTPAPEVRAPVAAKTTDGLHILLVEDEAEVAKFLTASLNSLGHTVTCCDNGDAAFVAYNAANNANTFDMLISDCVMPGQLQGPELARRLRGKRPDLPVILISGYAQSSQFTGTEHIDPLVQLQKPFMRDALVNAIDEAREHAKSRAL